MTNNFKDNIDLKDNIALVPNFPKEGILFYDISPLLINPVAWKNAVLKMAELIKEMKPDVLVGLESRGFFVASPIALELNLGFTMIRKKGKLPGETVSLEYSLEYSTDVFEIQKNIIKKGSRVVILDDLLATGGSIKAASELLKKIGANPVGTVCIIELLDLKGRDNIGNNLDIKTLIQF